MKKLFSIFAIFAIILTSGILLSACGDKEYVYHIPSQEDMNAAGIENISTSSGRVSKDDKTFYFRFMERYDYDETTLTVHFRNKKGKEVAVSGFEAMPENWEQRNAKTYRVELQKAEEITITLEGKARIETRNLQIEQIDDEESETENALTEEEKASLVINLEVNGKGTGDVTLDEFNSKLTSGSFPFLKDNQDVDYGSEIKITLYNKNAMSLFRGAVIFAADGYEGEGNWAYSTAVVDGKRVLKNTVTYELVNDITVNFTLKKEHFEEAKFDEAGAEIMYPGVFYYTYSESDMELGTFEMLGAEDKKISTLAEMFAEESVTLRVGGVEDTPIAYIAQKVMNAQSNMNLNFDVSVNGLAILDFQVGGKVQDSTYYLTFKNISVSHLAHGEFFTNKNYNNRIELVRVFWTGFQTAMNEEFVMLPSEFEYGQDVRENYTSGFGTSFDGVCFQIDGSRYYVLKNSQVEYKVFFQENASGKKFVVTVGDYYQEIELTEQEQVLTFGNGNLTLTYTPKAGESYTDMANSPMISVKGAAENFSLAMKIDVTE